MKTASIATAAVAAFAVGIAAACYMESKEREAAERRKCMRLEQLRTAGWSPTEAGSSLLVSDPKTGKRYTVTFSSWDGSATFISLND